MGNRHNKSFFGEDTGIIFDSGQSSSPSVLLRFIKKKGDGSWEKPSQKEGRAIKFSLVDVAFILQVLRGDKSLWETSHSFKERKIAISFERDSESVNIRAGDYFKLLNYGEIEVFSKLLEHVLQEKVIDSTEVKKRESLAETEKETVQTSTEEILEERTEHVLVETAILAGTYNGVTEKALLISFEEKKEIWIPKSAIRSNFDPKITTPQKFEIDMWILKKNKLL